MSDDRKAARAMASEALAAGQPLRWFEELYAASAADGVPVPWADLAVNPHLASWAGIDHLAPGRALVIGCGYGDDAEWLAAHGWDVTAFDISPSAVAQAQERFPDSSVEYVVTDLLALPRAWTEQPFDLVLEIYTIQVLPPGSPERRAAFDALASVTRGTLLVIARGREAEDEAGTMPWPLLVAELDAFTQAGLALQTLDDFLDGEDPPVRRLRAAYRS